MYILRNLLSCVKNILQSDVRNEKFHAWNVSFFLKPFGKFPVCGKKEKYDKERLHTSQECVSTHGQGFYNSSKGTLSGQDKRRRGS